MRSFINYILPEDEYQRLKVLYFIAEVTVILVIATSIISLLDLFIFNWNLWTIWILPWLVCAYIFYRYTFSGLEYGDVSTNAHYKKRKRKSLTTAFATVVLFYLITMLTSGGFTDKSIALDKLMLAIIFFIFFYAFDRISLARSYRKNKELDDE